MTDKNKKTGQGTEHRILPLKKETWNLKSIPPTRTSNSGSCRPGAGDFKVSAELFGGQGTINVNSWSPDSRQIAFVSYRLKQIPLYSRAA
jgi:hypothetical protein